MPQTTASPNETTELYAIFRVAIPIVDKTKAHGGRVEAQIKKARRALEDRLTIKRSWRIFDGVTLTTLPVDKEVDEAKAT